MENISTNDKRFLVNVLQGNINLLNEQLLRNDLGEIERDNFQKEIVKSKELIEKFSESLGPQSRVVSMDVDDIPGKKFDKKIMTINGKISHIIRYEKKTGKRFLEVRSFICSCGATFHHPKGSAKKNWLEITDSQQYTICHKRFV